MRLERQLKHLFGQAQTSSPHYLELVQQAVKASQKLWSSSDESEAMSLEQLDQLNLWLTALRYCFTVLNLLVSGRGGVDKLKELQEEIKVRMYKISELKYNKISVVE
jgi:hypothetical protein